MGSLGKSIREAIIIHRIYAVRIRKMQRIHVLGFKEFKFEICMYIFTSYIVYTNNLEVQNCTF